MATDVETLLVRLEASQAKFEKQMAAASQTANRRALQIEARFARMNKTLSAGASRFATAFTGALAGALSVRALQDMVDGATQITNALKVAGLAGDDLNKVYHDLFASAQENAAPIADLVELYSRASMAASNLGASQEDLRKFTDNVAVSLRVSGKSAQEASGALLQLSQLLGGQIVQAQEYNSLIDGAYPLLQAVAAGMKDAGGDVAKLTALVKNGKVPVKAFFDAFQAGSAILREKVASSELTISQRFVRLQNVMLDAARRFNQSSQAANTFGEAIDNVADFISHVDFDSLISEIGRVIDKFYDGVGAINDFAYALGKATGLGALGEALTNNSVAHAFGLYSMDAVERRMQGGASASSNGLTADAVRNSEAGKRLLAEATSNATDIGTIQKPASSQFNPISLADYSGVGGSSKGGSSRHGISDSDRQKKQIDRVVDSLKFEQEQLGRTDREQQVYNALKEAGVDIGSKQGQQIAELVGHLYDQEQAMDGAARAADFLNGALSDAFTDLIPKIKTGNDALDNFLNTLIEASAQALFFGQGPLGAVFGGGKGLLGGLLSGFGGFFADGGTLGAGKWGIAGEAGPEVIKGPANILPMRSSSPSRLHITVGAAFDGNGNILPFVKSVAQGEAASAAAGVARAVPSMVDARNSERQTRRIRPQAFARG